jgi:hypothetical protein
MNAVQATCFDPIAYRSSLETDRTKLRCGHEPVLAPRDRGEVDIGG